MIEMSQEPLAELETKLTRVNTIQKWEAARLIQLKQFRSDQYANRMLNFAPDDMVRVVVGDAYVDAPMMGYPSEKLVATIALLLQAQGKL